MNLPDKIVMRPAAALVPYASNSRTHSPGQIDKLCRSIQEFGFTNPILVDGENGVVAGHARLTAAQKLGLADVPTIDLSWLSSAQRQAYLIADNRLAEANLTSASFQREIVDARFRERRRCRKLPEAELRDACGTGARLVVAGGRGRGVLEPVSARVTVPLGIASMPSTKVSMRDLMARSTHS